MVVSRYTVDGIEIAGLLVGALGVLYLAQGLFGRVGSQALRVILVALSVGLIYLLTLLLRLIGLLPVPPGGGLTDKILGVPNYVAYIFGFIVVVAMVTAEGMDFGDPDARRALLSKDDLREDFVVIATLSLGFGIVFKVTSGHSIGEALLVTIVAGITLIGIRVVGILAFALKERQLQLFGLVLTLLGIATQFVSPILDLLNIPAR